MFGQPPEGIQQTVLFKVFAKFLHRRFRKCLDTDLERRSRLVRTYWASAFDSKLSAPARIIGGFYGPAAYQQLSSHYDPESEAKVSAIFLYLTKMMFPDPDMNRLQASYIHEWLGKTTPIIGDGVPGWKRFYNIMRISDADAQTQSAFEWFTSEEDYHIERVVIHHLNMSATGRGIDGTVLKDDSRDSDSPHFLELELHDGLIAFVDAAV